MSYNTDLQTNNDELQTILNTINALPEVLPEQAKTVIPSLSDQTIIPDNGKTLSSVQVSAITKELLANLDSDFIADNIAKDIDLFGLVGTLESGGVTYGTITIAEENRPYTIAHGLGVKPSILLFVFLPDDSFSKIVPIYTSIVGKYGAGQIVVNGNGMSGSNFTSLYFSTDNSSEIESFWNCTHIFGAYSGYQMVNDETFTLNMDIGIRTYLWVAIA